METEVLGNWRDVSDKRNIPVMTFPMKKIINTELFIDRKQTDI